MTCQLQSESNGFSLDPCTKYWELAAKSTRKNAPSCGEFAPRGFIRRVALSRYTSLERLTLQFEDSTPRSQAG